MKKITALFLIFTSLVATFSCGNNEGDKKGETTTASSDESTTEQKIEDILGFASEDNGDKDFNMLVSNVASYEYDAEEVTGDVVNDAVYYKNAAVEDYLGIKFNFVYQDGGWNQREAFNGFIKNDVLADSKEYDLVSSAIVITMPIACDGYFIDGNSLTYCNFENPWWIQNMYERFSCSGKLYGFLGDFALSTYKDMSVIFFNKRIWDEFKAEDPYELVRNDEWTLDKFLATCSGMSKDLNGDGEYDTTDQLNYVGEYVPLGTFQTVLDVKIVKFNDDGVPEYIGLTEKLLTAFEKLYPLNHAEDTMCFSSIDNGSYESQKTFANGNVATMCNFLYSTEYLRDMKDDYGILPMPKYDDNQENYITQLGTSTSMFFVPLTTTDVNLTSKVMESLSYYNQQLVVPKYYEVALKEKYARDDDMAEMLDIIRNGANIDFLFVYGTSLTGAPNDLFRMYAGLTDLSSYLAGKESTFTTSLEEMIEKYTDLES